MKSAEELHTNAQINHIERNKWNNSNEYLLDGFETYTGPERPSYFNALLFALHVDELTMCDGHAKLIKHPDGRFGIKLGCAFAVCTLR